MFCALEALLHGRWREALQQIALFADTAASHNRHKQVLDTIPSRAATSYCYYDVERRVGNVPDFNNINKKSEESAEAVFPLHQDKKFNRMREKASVGQQPGIDQQRWVVNLSSRTLTNMKQQVLRRGLNFTPAPQKIPLMDITAAVEGVAQQMDNEKAASDLRGSICSILRRAKPPPSNLDKSERTALKTLKEDKSITVLPANKGNATVVLDMAQYEKKVKDLLADQVYKKLKKDPTLATKRRVLKEVRELEKREQVPRELHVGGRLKPTASKPPKLYGLQKIHTCKPQVPLRPTASAPPPTCTKNT